MLTGILIISIASILGILSHRKTRLENRIYRHIPLSDWLQILILPIGFYTGWFLVVKNIIAKPNIGIFPLEDLDFLAISLLFMIYGFVGAAIHFTGKILWRYLKNDNHSMAYKINEMFHGKSSHYLVFLNLMFILSLLPVIEINHPVLSYVTFEYLILTVLAGIIVGYAGSRAVFYTNEWFGGYNKPLFFISSMLLLFLMSLNKFYGINYSYYPVSLFALAANGSFVSAFVIRQAIIFSKLGTKRRFRFLAKIFSA